MVFNTKCHECGGEIVLREAEEGAVIQCPFCGLYLKIVVINPTTGKIYFETVEPEESDEAV